MLDGFDLGIGILFPFVRADDDRDVMMNSVAPVWDGNETWLVLGGGGLLAAFPLAYAVLLPALYLPLILMLLALIFRGVAFEFRFSARAHAGDLGLGLRRRLVVAALCQGVVAGRLHPGRDGRRARLRRRRVRLADAVQRCLTGVGLLVGYALLGATWLVMKTEGALQDAPAELLPLLLASSLLARSASSASGRRWPRRDRGALVRLAATSLYFAPVPLLVGAVGAGLLRPLPAARHAQPFLLHAGPVLARL